MDKITAIKQASAKRGGLSKELTQVCLDTINKKSKEGFYSCTVKLNNFFSNNSYLNTMEERQSVVEASCQDLKDKGFKADFLQGSKNLKDMSIFVSWEE